MNKLRSAKAILFLMILAPVAIFAQQVTQSADSQSRDGSSRTERAIKADRDGEEGAAGLINSGNYAFQSLAGIPLEDMSSGTTLLMASNSDDQNSPAAQIGFLFRFDGVNYTTFGVNVNGLAKLGGAPTTSSSLNAINSTTNAPKLMPYWDDLCVGGSGKIHYKTLGTFGSRKLVVEWQNMKITRGNTCDGSGAGTFQMWLFEGTGVIQYVYGNGMDAAAASNGGYSIGIQSGAASNFASVTTASGTVDYTTANNTQLTAITAGTAYLFSPPVPAAPTGGGVSPVRQTSLTLNWSDNASGEEGYIVWRSTDNSNFSVAATLPADSVSYVDTGLNPSTQYFYRVSAAGTGAFSPMLALSATTNAPGSVAATASGGLWSAPATWASGVVPDGADTVTIPGGATVTIDTDALAGNVIVGSSSNPAVLRFGETAAYSLKVAGNITIGPNDFFTTGGGNANQHVLTVSGDLINNGTLDFSTNNNQAGAGIVFTGASNNTFGGTGPVTDIRTITISKGPTNANILELSPSNFTVQGTTTDGPVSGFLFLNSGTFKISGTFSGNHRTFVSAAYQIVAAAGLWLNNPNYTIAAQNDSAVVLGLLRVSAGTYNVGTATLNDLNLISGSTTIVEGGNIRTAGVMGPGSISPPATQLTYNQSGGTVTTCTVGRFSSTSEICFDMGESTLSSVSLTGGDIVIQNTGDGAIGINESYRNLAGPASMATITGTTVHFGNASSTGIGMFKATGRLPNVSIDASAGPQAVTLSGTTRNINIGTNGLLIAALTFTGTSFINNGVLQGQFEIEDGTGLTDVTYGGVGSMSGIMTNFRARCRTLTFDPSVGNIKAYNVKLTTANVVNSARMTIGNNDTQMSTVELYNGATFDSAPDLNIGSGGERVVYGGSGSYSTGPEIKSDRVLTDLSFDGTGSVTITGGDLTLTQFLRMTNGVIITGNNRLTLLRNVNITRVTGYVNGTLRRELVNPTASYAFDVGQNGYTPVTVWLSALGGPSFLSIRSVDATMPGMLPATSLSRYWHLEEEGDVTARLNFFWLAAGDVRGNAATYKLWRSSGGGPAIVPGSTIQSGIAIQSPEGVTEFNGDWTAGNNVDPGPVSISGTVSTSTGAGIRNAIVTISGGNLPSPVTVQTGNFGTYVFNGLQAGEVYTVTVGAKRFRFATTSQQVTPLNNVAGVNFTANPQEEF